MIVKVEASKTYDVYIESGASKRIGEFLDSMYPGRKVALISDDNVAPIYLDKIKRTISSEHETVEFILPNGEASKNGENYLRILNFLAKERLTRKDLIVGVGGGVVGDLSGFAAATYLRGISYINIPTSLLAMVDSSVGGKTAIDLDEGKNLAGAFYQPELVLCDYDVLDTLPDEIYRDGCAEVIKYGMIWDRELFDHLSEGVFTDREKVIGRCIEIKRDVVNEDEKDLGIRQILNFGHTIGHAVEKCSSFEISHGKAVAIGMAMITRAAYKKGYCEREVVDRLEDILDVYGLPKTCGFSADELASVSLSDKKRAGKTINFIIPREIGKVEIVKTPVEEIREIIESGIV